MRIAIIGGGASGLMAGGFLADSNEVLIFDGNEKVGKKLFITGKGRCNLTNNCDKEEFLNNVIKGQKFMMSAINAFDSTDTMALFEGYGLDLKTERGNRVFPASDKSSDVIKALVKHAENCEIKLEEKVLAIVKTDDGFLVKTQDDDYYFDRVVIATGGKSYPGTGSTGDGYKFAKMLGHSIIEPKPALAPIKIKNKFVSALEGLSLKNVELRANIDGKDKKLFGEMLFTADAISGPIALSLSSFIGNAKSVELTIDFKPALNEEMLEKRILRDFENNLNKNVSYIIKGLLPNRLVDIFLNRAEIDGQTKVNAVTSLMRKNIVQLLKHFPLEYNGLYPIEAGIITSGGVNLKEINPKTMESKLVKGVYFIGEVLDVDCLTGGFNLQVAFSTAVACAKNLN
ncbi:MAG: NAD(P)/FAD-dependent oxidoreductase [Clostridiales bacterium]|nr:NAD(P)/FAD-dependent oxidoreductase [Clostridiales bacterium]